MAISTVKFSDWADAAPANGSTNGVTSDGVYDAIAESTYWVTSSTSFEDACTTAGISYWGPRLDTYVAANISNLNEGFSQLSVGGPVFGMLLLKYSDSFYGGIMTSYFVRNDRPFIRFAYQDGTYGVHRI